MSEGIRGNIRITVARDGAALVTDAAELFGECARDAVARAGRFSVALAGGRTPEPLYEHLARSDYRDAIPWARANVFWGDERCVAPTDPRSNERMARRALLDDVPVPDGQVHPIRCASDPDATARAYEAVLRSYFGEAPRFDLVLLGLGTNGHTASLFPGTAALEEDVRWVAPVPPAEDRIARVTLTLPVLQQAAHTVFLVAGEAKAAIVRQVLQGDDTEGDVPASRVRPVGTIHWLLDAAAASQLDGV
jgi:6-phosphogluconolactonase